MIVTLQYHRRDKKDPPDAKAQVRIRLTPKRIFVEERIGSIEYLNTDYGTKRAVYLSLPKVYNRENGRPIQTVVGGVWTGRGWYFAPGEIDRIKKETEVPTISVQE